MIVVTGATGQLGRLVIKALLRSVPASDIVAAVRSPDKAKDLAALGIAVRQADYTKPDTLRTAFAGADKLLLISSSEVGQRAPQHRAAIDAAKAAGVKLIAYTSILRADNSPLSLAAEHLATEVMLKESGVPFVVLRNGWYTENYTGWTGAALASGTLIGSAGDGRIASAARADYAEAAAAVLTRDNPAGAIYELAGDSAYTLTELAAEIARQSGKPVLYKNLSETEHKAALLGFGLPEPIAAMLANSDAGVSKGALFDDGRQLSQLIGHATTPLAATVGTTMAALAG
ncbi:SDR family oxidoreductase [Variovorax rhizosphaerae]|uniref:SDR family oxidoreductase n=1 Tax=Variovorax rhizosphaerae TaxID=1836200 RepID=A0ABU8WWD9_9BURK